jgi:hypothetical protein
MRISTENSDPEDIMSSAIIGLAPSARRLQGRLPGKTFKSPLRPDEHLRQGCSMLFTDGVVSRIG